MGISSTISRVTYTADGTSAVFLFPYEFTNTTDLLVYVQNNLTGAISTLSSGADYSLAATPNQLGIYPQGGTVTTVLTPTSGYLVTLVRAPSLVQNYQLSQNATISGPALVNQMDYLTMLMQRVSDTVSRAIKLKDGMGQSFDPSLPQDIYLKAGSVLIVNSSGLAFDVGLAIGSSGFTGVLGPQNGGIGTTVPPNIFGVMYGASLTSYSTTQPGPQDWPLVANASSAPTFQQMSLGSSAAFTGVLQTSKGGTGINSLTPTLLVYASSATQFGQISTGTSGWVLTSNGAAPPTYQVAAPTFSIRNVTSSGSSTNADSVLLISGTSSIQQLYTAVGNAGKSITLIHSGSSFTNLYTINTTSGQTIGGIASGAYVLYTLGERLQLVSDNVNWQIMSHQAETGWFSVPLVITGSGSPTTGTSSISVFKFKRSANTMKWKIAFSQTTGGTAGTSGDYFLTLPMNQIFDSSVVTFCTTLGPNTVTIPDTLMGFGQFSAWKSLASESGTAVPFGTSVFRVFYNQANATWCQNGAYSLNIAQDQIGDGEFPIFGWQP